MRITHRLTNNYNSTVNITLIFIYPRENSTEYRIIYQVVNLLTILLIHSQYHFALDATKHLFIVIKKKCDASYIHIYKKSVHARYICPKDRQRQK